MLHPVAWAGWAGLLVPALNLIPAGQLDGAHLFFVRFGAPAAKRMLPFILGGLVVLGFVWNGWWLWAGLVFLLGRRHAEPLDTITPLDENRRLLAVVALVVFVLTFTPVPLALFQSTHSAALQPGPGWQPGWRGRCQRRDPLRLRRG